jgi:hypothetical protein
VFAGGNHGLSPVTVFGALDEKNIYINETDPL